MEIPVTFAGGRVVEAVVGNHVVRTDQPVSSGGSGTAPSPCTPHLAPPYAAPVASNHGEGRADRRISLAWFRCRSW